MKTCGLRSLVLRVDTARTNLAIQLFSALAEARVGSMACEIVHNALVGLAPDSHTCDGAMVW